jgi:murein DD-endopeptidase MepM/ murein hydrolase activator NlpD
VGASVGAGRGDERAPAGATAAGAAAILPVAGRLTSGFGARPDPFTGEARFHGGVDLAAPRGTPVRAVAAGEVVFAGRRGRAGNVVEVRHPGGLTTTYAHLERAAVAAGQKVDAGEVLATVGASGRATGPHLHFAAAIDGQPIDPAELFVGAGPPERAPGRAG